MLYLDTSSITDARRNLALEEYVFRQKELDDDLLLFYVNAPSIIIGRNQNTIEEINAPMVEERGVTVVRRISGGGAVYHDLGNLNFSFITRDVHNRFNRYDTFNKPVVDVLRALGVPAEISGRNDILADGRKISGNAQFATPTRMFSPGTLLLDSNLDDVTAVLKPRPGKVESKGMKSIRSRVANISEFLASPIDVHELRALILERIFDTRDLSRIPHLALDDADVRGVDALQASKYGTETWNFGENPPSNVQRATRFPAGEIDVRLDVKENRIVSVRIFGDFMGRSSVSEIEEMLTGVPYERSTVAAALEHTDFALYFGDVPREGVLALLMP
ncbi:MAG: lipoate--protein ligase [Gemmatimonadetes bacterium]|nr:lipoate--protein ligase [Gemmatimonadota bacterium]